MRHALLQLLYSLLGCTQETLVWDSDHSRPGGAMSNNVGSRPDDVFGRNKKPLPAWAKAIITMIAVGFFLAWFVSTLSAQTTEGRPDPTGQGRYIQIGGEVTYPQARVVSGLPQGAECMHPGELVGVMMYNSTREGRAVSVKLTDKATVAVVGDRVFLCKCAGGFNQLFRISPTSGTASSATSNTPAGMNSSSASVTAGSSATPTTGNAALEAANAKLAALEAEIAKLRQQQSQPQAQQQVMVVDGNPAMRNIAVFEAFPDCVLRLSASGKLSPEQASKDCRDTYRIERNGATNASRAQGSVLHGGGPGSGFGFGVTGTGQGGSNIFFGSSGRVW